MISWGSARALDDLISRPSITHDKTRTNPGRLLDQANGGDNDCTYLNKKLKNVNPEILSNLHMSVMFLYFYIHKCRIS